MGVLQLHISLRVCIYLCWLSLFKYTEIKFINSIIGLL